MDNTIQYRYGKIELEQFATFAENYNPDEPNVQIKTDTQFAYDKKNSVLCSTITVQLFYPEKPLIKAELNSYFDINPDTIRPRQEDGMIVFSKGMLVQFASLCYGTLRGVIYAKTKDTPLSKLILPPLYFDEIIDKEFVVEEEK